MTGRKSQIPTGHLEHSPCHKVCASDAVQSVDNTAARPNDPRRQTAGRVVSVCVCTCAITLRMYVTFWQLQMSIAAHLFAFVCVCVCDAHPNKGEWCLGTHSLRIASGKTLVLTSDKCAGE